MSAELEAIGRRALQLARRHGLPQVLLALARATPRSDDPPRRAVWLARLAIAASADAYGVDRRALAQLYAKAPVLAVPRVVAVCAFREVTKLPAPTTAAAFGFDDHSPILMARRRLRGLVGDAMQADCDHASRYARVLARVGEAWVRTDRAAPVA